MLTMLPNDIQPVVAGYADALLNDVPGLVSGCYLHGSIALDAFDARQSDIDLVAVLARTPTPAELSRLRQIHRRTAAQSRWTIEGCYLTRDALGQPPATPALCIHGGSLDWQKPDVCPVTWWLLRQRGVTVFGPHVSFLGLRTPWSDVETWIRGNLQSYWRTWATGKAHRLGLLQDASIEWAVLGVLRLWYSLREQDITSKLGAGYYALSQIEPRWHPIIRESLALRERTNERHYTSRLARARDAIALLDVMTA